MAWSALYEPSACCAWRLSSSLAAPADARLVSIDSCQAPRRVKMCEGMCSAWGAEGAIAA